MTKLRIALLGLALACSAVDANSLWGVWFGEHTVAEGEDATLTFGEDGTCKVEVSVPEAEAAGLFAEMFGDLLHDLDLSVEGVAELGLAIPAITHVVLEGSYTVEGDFLTVFLTRFLLGVEGGQSVEIGQFMADVARQLLDLHDKETTDLELIVALTVMAESGPLFTELVLEEMKEEGPFIASGFSIQADRLTFREGEFAGAVFVHQDGTATAVQTKSWGHIKGWIAP